VDKLLNEVSVKYEERRYANRCDAERDLRDLVDKIATDKAVAA
jgi:hypothetical protein